MSEDVEFEFRRPKPNRAKRLIKEAMDFAEQGDAERALGLVNRAIQLDHIGELNSFRDLKIYLCKKLNDDGPHISSMFYHHAIKCAASGRYRDAKVAYLEAASIDPSFLWPLNNFSWLLATCKDATVRNGAEAMGNAWLACEASKWNCWAFINTLAASFAEMGKFNEALGWQKVVLELAPAERFFDNLIQFRLYQSGLAYVDEGLPTAAGVARPTKRLD